MPQDKKTRERRTLIDLLDEAPVTDFIRQRLASHPLPEGSSLQEKADAITFPDLLHPFGPGEHPTTDEISAATQRGDIRLPRDERLGGKPSIKALKILIDRR